MPEQWVGGHRPRHLVGAAEQVVGGHLQCVRETAQVVERRLARAALEVGDGALRQARLSGERRLAQLAGLARGSQPFRERIGTDTFDYGDFDILLLTTCWDVPIINAT